MRLLYRRPLSAASTLMPCWKRTLLSVMLVVGSIGLSAASAEATPTSTLTASAGVHMHKTNSNLCLVARIGSGERPVEQTVCGGYSDQDWDFIYVYKNKEWVNHIRNIDRNLCIVTRGYVETPAVVTGCDAQYDDQLWRAFDIPGRGLRFQNVNSGLCLVARFEDQATQTACGDFPDQFWLLD